MPAAYHSAPVVRCHKVQAGTRHRGEGREQHGGPEQLAPHADRVEDGLAAPERAAADAAHGRSPCPCVQRPVEAEGRGGRAKGNGPEDGATPDRGEPAPATEPGRPAGFHSEPLPV